MMMEEKYLISAGVIERVGWREVKKEEVMVASKEMKSVKVSEYCSRELMKYGGDTII